MHANEVCPGAYLTDEEHLFEVRRLRDTPAPFGARRRDVLLENCETFGVWVVALRRVCREMRLIRAAPGCPPTPESLLRKEHQ